MQEAERRLAKLAADGLGIDPSDVQRNIGFDEELKCVRQARGGGGMRELESQKLKQQFNQIRDLKIELSAKEEKLVEQYRESASPFWAWSRSSKRSNPKTPASGRS